MSVYLNHCKETVEDGWDACDADACPMGLHCITVLQLTVIAFLLNTGPSSFKLHNEFGECNAVKKLELLHRCVNNVCTKCNCCLKIASQ